MRMMIKITEHCSMGCSHCMNRALPNGKHMDFNTFKKAIEFQRKHGALICLISGGEPTEHPDFTSFIDYALNTLKDTFFVVATNGVWMQDNYDKVEHFSNLYGIRLTFQVTNDARYYPTKVDLTLPVLNQCGNVYSSDKISHIYPQGRALDNGYSWKSKCSRCFNVRAIAHQVEHITLKELIETLGLKVCTPHITINGSIKLGESDLCPVCSHIDKSEEEIMQDILSFRCQGCNHVNNKLPEDYRKLIGE